MTSYIADIISVSNGFYQTARKWADKLPYNWTSHETLPYINHKLCEASTSLFSQYSSSDHFKVALKSLFFLPFFEDVSHPNPISNRFRQTQTLQFSMSFQHNSSKTSSSVHCSVPSVCSMISVIMKHNCYIICVHSKKHRSPPQDMNLLYKRFEQSMKITQNTHEMLLSHFHANPECQ
jgi:hypothetical protein